MMLSYIFKQVNEFERNHGVRPNLLYLNQYHVASLEECFGGLSLQNILEFLKLDLVVDRGTNHPAVAWAMANSKRAV